MDDLKEIVSPLLIWYAAHKRDLPWRGSPDAYRVWVSEIMLQQTRVEAVKGYYARFLAAFPTVYDLANAPEDRLLKLWEGLGYYSRARNMQRAAKMIAERYHGEFPREEADLLALPGIGDYTAGAIRSIAFGIKSPAVDGNVLRVLARYTGDDAPQDTEAAKKSAKERLAAVYPEEAGAFTQALMDLGATVCVPNGVPKCGECPLRSGCASYKDGKQLFRPVKSPKKARKVQDVTVFLLKSGDLYAVEKRQEKGVLSGLYQFPAVYGEMSVEDVAAHLASMGGKELVPLYEKHKKHVFTHIEWRMTAFCFTAAAPFGPYLWVTGDEVTGSIGLPSAFRSFFPF